MEIINKIWYYWVCGLKGVQVAYPFPLDRSDKRYADMKKKIKTLKDKYKPSEPCSCEICRSYCARPGWWTVEEAECAFQAGLGDRMMLEISPEFTFGVLSPAFKGCEQKLALQHYSSCGCTFLSNDLCTLHGSGFMPLECRFCHHDRQGRGVQCHAEIERDWNSQKGQALVERWSAEFGILKKYGAVR